jgi:hypothetical protein
MQHFLTYVKHSYEVILEAEARSRVNLEHEVEAFVVHTFAKYMEQPNIGSEPIAIKMMTTVNNPSRFRKQQFEQIAEECLLIDGLKLNSRKWPNSKYFRQMGVIALEHRAYSDRPPELLYEKIANHFEQMSYVLNNIRPGA